MRYIVLSLISFGFNIFATAQYFDHPQNAYPITHIEEGYYGDFDKNGLLDYVVAYWNNPYVSVNYQISDGVYETKRVVAGEITPGPHYDMAVGVGDLNHDGQDDIITCNNYRFSHKKIFILLSDGQSFKTPIVYETNNCLWSSAVSIADFNKDTHSDFFVGVDKDSKLLVGYKGKGDGTFEQFTISFPYGEMGLIRSADFNQDGHLDFAAQNASSSDIYLYYGDGNFGFLHTKTLASSGLPAGMVCADFNGDSYPEIVTALSDYVNTLNYFTNNGNNTFGRKDIYLKPNRLASGRSLQLFDLHNDHSMDLITSDFSSVTGSIGIEIFENAGTHTFNQLHYSVPRSGGIVSLDVAPVGNGFAVLLIPSPFEVMMYQLTTLTDMHVTYTKPNLHMVDAALVDINNDGYSDIVAANLMSHAISVQYNAKNRNFSEPEFFHTIDPPYDVAVADINHDGFNDIVYCTYDEMNLSPQKELGILLGDATGRFSNRLEFPHNGYALALADFDTDGRLDIFTGNSLLLSGGSTNLTYHYFPTFSEARNAAAADIDRDGNQDIITLGTYPDGLRIFFGAGDGSFPTQINYPLHALGQNEMVIMDTNNDLFPEIYICGVFEKGIFQFINERNKTFTKKLIGPDESVSSVVLSDFNKDGFIDIVAGIYISQNLQVLTGDLSHNFSPSTIFGYSKMPGKMRLEDLDNDGQPDILSFYTGYANESPILYGRNTDPGPEPASSNVSYSCIEQHYTEPIAYVNPEPMVEPTVGPSVDPCYTECSCNIFFPNVITPDNNDKNEIFRGVWEEGLITLPQVTINIYNRWGKLIATTGAEGWNGLNASPGIYFWTCSFTCKDKGENKAITRQGMVSVVH